jgi:hypothetical protein
MPVISMRLKDITGVSTTAPVVFSAPVIREGVDGNSIITTYRRSVSPVDGIISVFLDPGPAVVLLGGKQYPVTIPTVDKDLWDLVSGAVAFPPGSTDAQIGAAITSYLTAHPIPGATWSTLAGIPPVVAAGSSAEEARGVIAAGTYSKPVGGVPSTDMTAAVQTSLGKADTALQSNAVTSVAGHTGAVTLAESDVVNLVSDLGAKYVKPGGGIPTTDLTAGIQTSLGKADSAVQSIPVTSVASRTGDVVLTKSDVGLSAVDNTSDATKNAAAVTLTNKTLTTPAITAPTGLVKADVGLGNVDNTADTAKPISSATQTALEGKGTYSKPGSGIPAGDLTAGVQASLGLADTSLQSAPVTSVAGHVGDVTIAESDVANLVSDLGAKYVKPGPGIPSTDMTSAVQTSLGKADTALQSNAVTTVAGRTGAVVLGESDITNLTTDLAAKYVKPGGGIPSTDMTSAVQTSLGKADTAFQQISVAAPTGVAATDNAAIVAAQALAAAAVATGGRPVLRFCTGTYKLSAPIVPAAGVSYLGAPVVQAQTNLGGGLYLADGEWTAAGGTVLQGDGTFACFQANSTDTGTVPANLGAEQISSTEISGFGIDNFTYGLRLGALNQMGLVWSKLDRLYVKNCSVWGVYLANFSHIKVGQIETTLCQNGMYFATRFDNDSYQPGNSLFNDLYCIIPQDGRDKRKVRGIVFSSYGVTGATKTAMSELHCGRIQVNGYNRALLTVTATFTNTSTSIGVPDGTQFMPGMLVNFTTAANGFNATQMYVVKSVSSNTITLSNSNTTAAITATAGTSLTLKTYGFPQMEVTSEYSNGQINTSRFDHLDIEGQASAGLYVENVSTCSFGITSFSASGLSDLVGRNAAFSRFETLSGAKTDFDSSSASSSFYGVRNATVQYPLRGLWYDAGTVGNVLGISNGVNNNVGGDIQARNGTLYPTWGMGDRIFTQNTSTTLAGFQCGVVVFNGATGQTLTLPTIVSDSPTPAVSHVGIVFDVYNISANSLTVSTDGTQLFNNLAASTSLTIPSKTGLRITGSKNAAGGFIWLARPSTLPGTAVNADTATALATNRNIGGVAFNGTADITPTVSTTQTAGDSTTNIATTAFATGADTTVLTTATGRAIAWSVALGA